VTESQFEKQWLGNKLEIVAEYFNKSHKAEGGKMKFWGVWSSSPTISWKQLCYNMPQCCMPEGNIRRVSACILLQLVYATAKCCCVKGCLRKRLKYERNTVS